jgi:hypothetical protein
MHHASQTIQRICVSIVKGVRKDDDILWPIEVASSGVDFCAHFCRPPETVANGDSDSDSTNQTDTDNWSNESKFTAKGGRKLITGDDGSAVARRTPAEDFQKRLSPSAVIRTGK